MRASASGMCAWVRRHTPAGVGARRKLRALHLSPSKRRDRRCPSTRVGCTGNEVVGVECVWSQSSLGSLPCSSNGRRQRGKAPEGWGRPWLTPCPEDNAGSANAERGTLKATETSFREHPRHAMFHVKQANSVHGGRHARKRWEVAAWHKVEGRIRAERANVRASGRVTPAR